MHIVATSQFYIPQRYAGSETAQHAALKALQDAGHRVEVLCAGGGGYDVDGIEVYHCSETRMLYEMSRRNPDVVLGQHSGWCSAAVYGKRFNKPSVYYTHNANQNTSVNLLRSPTLVVHNTRVLQQTYSKISAPSVILHPPVVAADHATTPGGNVTLVNLQKRKGVETFSALASLLPDTPFLGVEGGYGKQEFRHWPNVTYQQQTGDMATDVWSRTRILLMPSDDWESYGMVGVEALASGIPVIASPVPGIIEALSDAATYIDRDDYNAWRDKVVELQDGRRYKAASRRASRRSAEIEAARSDELNGFIDAIEAAHKFGRDDFREEWTARDSSN